MIDGSLGRTLLSPSEPRKTLPWDETMTGRVENELEIECGRSKWTAATLDCMTSGGACSSDDERQRERARALVEATLHELDAKIGNKSDPAKPKAPDKTAPPGADSNYPTAASAGTDKLFTTEDPDRGPKVPVDFATPPKADLTWSDHAYCEDDRTNIVCSPDPAPKGQIWSWKLGTRPKGDVIVAESWRAGRLVETFVYVLKGNGLADQRVKIDAYGRVVDALLFTDDRFSGRKVNGGNALEGCGGMEYKSGADKHLSEVACLQWGGEPMRDLMRTYKMTYKRNAMGFVTDSYRWDLDGKPLSTNDGIPHTVFERDNEGRVIAERYRDASDKPMAAKTGCFGLTTERDVSGTKTKQTCVSSGNTPIERVAQPSIEAWEHDAKGCFTKLRNFKADGTTRALDHDNTFGEKYTTDAFCANTVRECFGTDETSTECGPGEPSKYVYTRDAWGQATSSKHYNTWGTGRDPIYLAFELRKEWDGVGNNLAIDCYDEQGKRMLCGATGFAGDRSTYDDAGRRIEVKFVDENGKPGTNLGAATRKLKYDNYDHIFETRQYDKDDRPFILMGQTIRRDLFDPLHRHYAVLLLDDAGKPARYTGCYQGIACPNVPWHAMKVERLPDGTPDKNVYFDENGKEFRSFDCRTNRCFDE